MYVEVRVGRCCCFFFKKKRVFKEVPRTLHKVTLSESSDLLGTS